MRPDKSKGQSIQTRLNGFLTVPHELTIYRLPTWCTNYYLFI